MSDPVKIGAEQKVDLFYNAERRKFTAELPDGKQLSKAIEADLRKEIRRALLPAEAQFAYYIESWRSNYRGPRHGKVKIIFRRGSKYEVEFVGGGGGEGEEGGEGAYGHRFTASYDELYKLDAVDPKKVKAAADALWEATEAWRKVDDDLPKWRGE